ncbi:MAG: phosphomannose isomerase type II C-terminal cupin domain [Candidatus Alcyoniella australis]|nr:phosphomannose isomerase type II C-terminal cupin domain [Candidatus Alcyoniella australis]
MHDKLKSTAPWGRWEVLEHQPGFKVKRIEVEPGHRLSYQFHRRRSEHWLVVRGTALVILEGEQLDLEPGLAVDIPVGAAHRIANPGDQTVIFIEVQRGDYLEEDDIVRLEDDYNRKQR